MKRAGHEQYETKNYSEALKSFTEAIQLYPKNVGYFESRSACLIQMDNFKSALEDCQVAVARCWKPQPTCRIVKCYLALGRISRALDTIQKLNEIDPTNELIERYEEQCKNLTKFDKLATECFQKNDFKRTGDLNRCRFVAFVFTKFQKYILLLSHS